MQALLTKLEGISLTAESLHLDSIIIANSNLLEILRTQAAVRMVAASLQSGLARQESTARFVREDYPESNDDFLHHSTVDLNGKIGKLAIKKGAGGHWVFLHNEKGHRSFVDGHGDPV